MRRPPPLGAGARVALVAPAGPLRDESELARAIGNVRGFGWEPVVGRFALARRGYFAGSDTERLDDLNRALGSDAVDAVWCLRGGYGAMRLLEGIDYDAVRRRPKPFIGYSDISALHAAIGARCDTITFHGPTARTQLTSFSRESLQRALSGGGEPCGTAPEARVLHGGTARGRLAGGNLAVLAALAGTPFAPPLDGAVLVLEDIGEAVYRLDRMLRQLLLSGALRGCRALVFGAFTDCREDSGDGARTLDEVLGELAEALRVPCLAGLPVGHIDDQWTLPLGAVAEVDASARRVSVEEWQA